MARIKRSGLRPKILQIGTNRTSYYSSQKVASKARRKASKSRAGRGGFFDADGMVGKGGNHGKGGNFGKFEDVFNVTD